MAIPLVRGREFTERDDEAAPRVLIINESFARRYFPGQNPIGQRLKLGVRATEPETPLREIVGVVGDVRLMSLDDQARPAYYVPYPQCLISSLQIIARTAGPPAPMVESIRKAIAARDPELPIFDVRTMDEYIAMSVSSPRFEALLLGLFAALGLLLTAVGLYGVTSNGVAERTQEFGVRLALGASASDVLRGVLARGVMLAAIGLLVGIAAAGAASRLLGAALYAVHPFDPATFSAVSVCLLAVALLACWVPARRATSVDPIRALRAE